MPDFFYSYKIEMPGRSLDMRVVDSQQATIWEQHYPSYTPDAVSGQLMPDPTLIDAGIMKNTGDTGGLENYLKSIHVLQVHDVLHGPFSKSLPALATGEISDELTATVQRAKGADLVILPEKIKGTNCGNCKFISEKGNFCNHPKVNQAVNDRMCCIFWDSLGTRRVWQELENNVLSFSDGGNIDITGNIRQTMQKGGIPDNNTSWDINDFKYKNSFFNYDNFQDVIKQLTATVYETMNCANEAVNPTVFYLGYSFSEAEQELSTDSRDMDFADRDQTVVLYSADSLPDANKLAELKNLYATLSMDEFEERFPDKKSIADFVKWSLGDKEEVKYLEIPAINTVTQELLWEVQQHYGGKYSTIRLPNGRFLNLRIADHSANRGNNTGDRNLSVVIANLNKTEAFKKDFNRAHSNELYFDDSKSAEEIINDIDEAIEDIKQEEMPTSCNEKYSIHEIGYVFYIHDESTGDSLETTFRNKEKAQEYAKKLWDENENFSKGGKLKNIKPPETVFYARVKPLFNAQKSFTVKLLPVKSVGEIIGYTIWRDGRKMAYVPILKMENLLMNKEYVIIKEPKISGRKKQSK